MTQVLNKFITAEELFDMPSDSSVLTRFELVRGEIIEMPPAGFDHGRRSMDLASEMSLFVKRNGLGIVVCADTGFVISRNPDTVFAPDIAFVSNSTIKRVGEIPTRFFPCPPDLAVEVVSPSDRLDDVESKVLDYLAAGTTLVVVVMPRQKQVMLRRKDAQPLLIREGDLTFEDIVPGFAYSLAELVK
jgi:Uma2 family endonuclease